MEPPGKTEPTDDGPDLDDLAYPEKMKWFQQKRLIKMLGGTKTAIHRRAKRKFKKI